MAPILGYANDRGYGEQTRLLLHYLGIKFENKFYKFESPPKQSREWLAEKFNLGLDFPTVPYYIDGDFKLTQSSAIIEYIADKYDMLPNCKKHRAVLHMLQNDITDFRESAFKIIYYSHTDDEKEQFLKGIPDKLKLYEKYLGEKQWLTGDKINYPDFNLCELLGQLEKLEPTCLKDFAKLKAYLTRFENLPELKDYLASSEFKNRK